MKEDNDLFLHALNYRTADTKNAQLMFEELQSCVNRLIAEDRKQEKKRQKHKGTRPYS